MDNHPVWIALQSAAPAVLSWSLTMLNIFTDNEWVFKLFSFAMSMVVSGFAITHYRTAIKKNKEK